MGKDSSSSYRKNRPFDMDHCFYIQDFVKGDAVIIRSGRDRVKGVVESVNLARNTVVWKNANGIENECSLEEICFLQSHTHGWLD